LKPGDNSPETLTAKEVEEDAALLKFILRKAYAGRFVISKDIMRNVSKEIGAIKGPMATKEFCDKAGVALAKVPDYHLNIRYNGKFCSRAKEKPKSSVGKNVAKEKKRTWVVEKRKYKNSEYLLIAISRFPSHKSSKWNGFIEMVKKLHNPAIPVIFDLRSNGGGDDTFGYRLSALFHKSKRDFDFPNPYEKQITSQTPETQVLKVNVAKYWLRGKISEKEPLENYLREQESELEKLLANSLPEQKVSYNDKVPNDWAFSGHGNPIYILIDENCYSSCESTVDTFEYNPNVKKVGRSTGGMIHFGNVSPAFLKHSKLYVQTPTHANIYRDGRFIEKEGIKPDLMVPN
jgi:C-terminal processing protease CtpA/Prc